MSRDSTSPRSARARRERAHTGEAVTLKAADPFDLIRWLARSQGDPRKAVAELVQNSLDAGARHVLVERRRIGGAAALVVRDDGDGVLPEMPREEALRYLARHIGHSRKAKLTPLERRERIIAGKYGVGLLGFWAIGRRFELRSRVDGGPAYALCLVEDEPGGRIVEIDVPSDAPSTFTEAVVRDIHEPALRTLAGARLASYLGSELRGMLLGREVELLVHDAMARGLAQKRFEVRPKRFIGERLDLPASFPSPLDGFSPLHVELYLARGETGACVQLACAGTIVADDVRELAGLGLDADPWVDRELVGIIDFPDLNVPPGTRRGVIPDAAADALVAALDALRPFVLRQLARFDNERERETHRDLARELRKALRGFGARLPQYELPAIARTPEASPLGGPRVAAPESVVPGGAPMAERGPLTADELPAGVGDADAAEEAPVDEIESVSLFAPGPLTGARIVPDPIVLRPGRERRVRADALDEDDRIIRVPLGYAWHIDGPDQLSLRGEGPRPALLAEIGTRTGNVIGTLHVTIEDPTTGARSSASATLAVDEGDDASALETGVPDPLFESDARGAWRSRFEGARWIVNDAHEDWLALRGDGRSRLRYILALFAKDLVLRSFAGSGGPVALDRMVEILAHAERNLRGG